jgi:hypothetical protein
MRTQGYVIWDTDNAQLLDETIYDTQKDAEDDATDEIDTNEIRTPLEVCALTVVSEICAKPVVTRYNSET